MNDDSMTEFQVYHSLQDAAAGFRDTAGAGPVVTIGNFDGVHRGHQAIFAQVRALADARAAQAVALSFTPHPVRFFRPDIPAFRLTTDTQKARLIAAEHIDALVLLPFDAALAGWTPEEFVQQVLHQALRASCVVVGEGFHFGKGRAGSTDDLIRLGAERGIQVEVAHDIAADEEVVSSTRVRNALKHGDVALAANLLGRAFFIDGTVVQGDKRGRELGFPTANIQTPNPLLPAHGVYVSRLHVPRLGALRSLTSIGTRPTFAGEDVRVETFVLAGQVEPSELDLYGEDVTLEFLHYLRPELAFDSAEALIARMNEDLAAAIAYFDEN